MPRMAEDTPRGQSRSENAATSGESGWITTEVAARAVRVSPRTIRRYIERGELEAKPEGEGVRREWLVSVGSLHALRATRTTGEGVPAAAAGVDAAGRAAGGVRGAGLRGPPTRLACHADNGRRCAGGRPRHRACGQYRGRSAGDGREAGDQGGGGRRASVPLAADRGGPVHHRRGSQAGRAGA